MKLGAAVSRLASMDGEELRFRALCQARNLAGRVRHSWRPLRLERRALARVLDPASGPHVATAVAAVQQGEFLAAHRALATHFTTRSSRWPLQAARRDALVDELRQAYPDATREVRRRADRILEGRYDLLGYGEVQLENPPRWTHDVINRREPPGAYWTRVPYLDPAYGDHKVIWETNRHQYWLTLGSAWWLTGDRRYRDTFIAHLEDWIETNPPLQGVNWTSMLELGFRALSWTWAIEFFAADAALDETPWLVDLLVSLDAQLAHVAANLSRYFSPNTHLTGEALALYGVSLALPELRQSSARVSQGRAVLLSEATRQVHADGGHVELSAHYHRYTTDFYLLALMVARASGDPAAPRFEEAARRLARFLRTMADDRGWLPLIGDDDGGQLFRFGGRAPADAASTLALAASLLADGALAVGSADVDVAWTLGRRPETLVTGEPWSSRMLPDSGYFVSRGRDGSHLVFDAGRHGFLNGGHAHADALGVVLRVGGEPLLVDPGTATYVMEPALRDCMRSARMHNTVVLDGREHSIPRGPFHWQSRTDARTLVARTGQAMDFAVGTHDGYLPARHTRAVIALHGTGWLIVDRITAPGQVTADAWWHLHPSWHAALRDGVILLRSDSGRRLAFATTAGDVAIVSDPALSTFAPEYGRTERGTTIRTGQGGTAAFTIATFVPAVGASSESVAIVELVPQRSGEWIICPFAIAAGATDVRIEVAFPDAAAPDPSARTWPQPCIEQLVQSCVE